MAATPDASPRRHLIIAGTGRAGTTFLVRYLSAMGLDTHISRHGNEAQLDEAAQAGLEDFPLGPDADDLPYVIKNPMLYEFVDQVLTSEKIKLDGVIIPVRNLREATSSRLILERRSMYEHLPWLGFMDKAWDTVGNVPGGLIFSLNALDEARTLSMGLHLLIERLVQANVPMVFLNFPRIITDAGYLFEKLAPFLPAGTTAQAAADAHAKLADPEKVRTERETAAPEGAAAATSAGDIDSQVDRIALLREFARLRAAKQRSEADAQYAEGQHKLQLVELDHLRTRATDEVKAVRTELEISNAGFVALKRRYDELQEHFTLVLEQLEGLISERWALEQLARSAADANRRALATWRSVNEILGDFSDDVGSIAELPDTELFTRGLRERVAMMLEQLEASDRERTILAERLNRLETYSGRRWLRRLTSSRMLRRLFSGRLLRNRNAVPS